MIRNTWHYNQKPSCMNLAYHYWNRIFIKVCVTQNEFCNLVIPSSVQLWYAIRIDICNDRQIECFVTLNTVYQPAYFDLALIFQFYCSYKVIKSHCYFAYAFDIFYHLNDTSPLTLRIMHGYRNCLNWR